MSFPFPGPVPPYTNLPIKSQYYKPSKFEISAITLGLTTTVTTKENHNYVIGQQVRLLIPQSFGSYQLNKKTGYVIAIPADNQVVLDIDSSQNVNSFVNSSFDTKAQIIPIGDVNSGIISTTGRVIPHTNIPGSFINISP